MRCQFLLCWRDGYQFKRNFYWFVYSFCYWFWAALQLGLVLLTSERVKPSPAPLDGIPALPGSGRAPR